MTQVSQTEHLSASLEDYIESIYNIAARQRVARVTDIADDLGVAKSSVTGALRGLSAKGLVNYDPYHLITLTDEGSQVARTIARRHAILAEFLEEVLGIDATTAEANACRIEHAMEPAVTNRLLRFVEFVDKCPRGGPRFREGFRHFYQADVETHHCLDCLAEAVKSAQNSASPDAPCQTDKSKGAPHDPD